ncbi:MAG: ubiquitin-like domain-containing protein [Promethearchaeota archaeon]
MVNFLSENNGKTIKIRQLGVAPDQAIKLITIENSKANIKDIKNEIQNQLKLNPLLDIEIIFNGKLITDVKTLKELGFNLKKDIITVISKHLGEGGELGVIAYEINSIFDYRYGITNFFREITGDRNYWSNSENGFINRFQDANDVGKLNLILEVMYHICKIDSTMARRLGFDLGNIEGQKQQVIDKITDLLIEQELISDNSRELFEMFKEIAFLYSDANDENFVSFIELNNELRNEGFRKFIKTEDGAIQSATDFNIMDILKNPTELGVYELSYLKSIVLDFKENLPGKVGKLIDNHFKKLLKETRNQDGRIEFQDIYDYPGARAQIINLIGDKNSKQTMINDLNEFLRDNFNFGANDDVVKQLKDRDKVTNDKIMRGYRGNLIGGKFTLTYFEFEKPGGSVNLGITVTRSSKTPIPGLRVPDATRMGLVYIYSNYYSKRYPVEWLAKDPDTGKEYIINSLEEQPDDRYFNPLCGERISIINLENLLMDDIDAGTIVLTSEESFCPNCNENINKFENNLREMYPEISFYYMFL